MKPTKIYVDLHEGEPNDLGMDSDEIEVGSILNSDIIGLKNCAKDKVQYYKEKQARLIKKHGKRYTTEFHDDPFNNEVAMNPVENEYYIEDGILFIGGGQIFWGREKYNKRLWKMRDRGYGAGKIKRFFIGLMHKAASLRPDHYSEDFKDRAAKYAADLGCHTIVMGHKHPKKIADFEHEIFHTEKRYSGWRKIRIIVLTRGVHNSEDLRL